MRLPVNEPYTITTPFGVPDSNALFGKHSGVDFAVPLNRPIYAPASGQLTQVVSKTGGIMVVIYDGKYCHRLMHNTSFSKSNGPVSEGTEVAKAGTTGLSTGVHCHWDVNTQGTYPTSFAAFINPLSLLGGEIMPDSGTVQNIVKDLTGNDATPTQIEVYTKKDINAPDGIYYGYMKVEIERIKNQSSGGYTPITEQLFRKK